MAQPQQETTAEAINRLADALIARQPQQRGPLEMTGISDARKNVMQGLNADGTPLKGQRWRRVAGKSPATDATFTMLVVESRTHPDGRITEIHDYKHPAGTYTHEDQGGLVPNGLEIYISGGGSNDGKEPRKETLTPNFLAWRWHEFYQKDLRLVIGDGKRAEGALRPHFCADPAGMQTPWKDGFASREDAP